MREETKALKLELLKARKVGIEKRNFEIVKNMLRKKYSIEQISDITGVTKEEIEKIKENIC